MFAMVTIGRITGTCFRSASIIGTQILCIVISATALHSSDDSEVVINEYDASSLLSRASSGDGQAQLELARYYDARSAADPSLEAQALMWYRAAAHGGLVEAQRSYGERLITQPQTDSDVRIGMRWLRTASANDDPVALYRLGIAHRTGEGVMRNEVRAFELFRTAADLGHPPALIELALHYEFAIGTAFSIEDALYWYRQAAQYGSTAAELRLAEIYATGRCVPRNLETARNWCRAAAAAGNARALYLDGLISYRMARNLLYKIGEEQCENKVEQ
jgi:TPR repeat protein